MPTSDRSTRPPRILIVDDEDTIREQLEAAFSFYSAPFEREYATTGTGALARVEMKCYEALLLDLDLPDMTGGGSAVLIHRFDPALPIAFFTNHSREAVEHLLALIPNAVYWHKVERVQNPEKLIADIVDLAAPSDRCDSDPVSRKNARAIGDAEHFPLVTEVLNSTHARDFHALVMRARGGL